jgi:hypothetical protein
MTNGQLLWAAIQARTRSRCKWCLTPCEGLLCGECQEYLDDMPPPATKTFVCTSCLRPAEAVGVGGKCEWCL